MTYEQALAINQNFTPEQVRNDLERYLLRGEEPIVKGVAMAMQALEKQIPKKPDYEGDGYDDNGELIYDTWICPCCEEHYEVDYDNYKYCPNCGQALEWNKEK